MVKTAPISKKSNYRKSNSQKIRRSNYNVSNKTKELKKERRLKAFLIITRTLLISSFALGALWLLVLPNWVIRSQNEIKVKGNQFLSEQEVRSLIPFSYPQPLVTMTIANLEQKLETNTPFSDVVITRKILPPELIIDVTERQPVAIAQTTRLENNQNKIIQLGYLDDQGILMENKFYQDIPQEKLKLPTLKIIGIPDQYLPHWQNLYSLVKLSEVKIKTIDWRNPTNLILDTELGKVHLGAYSLNTFPEQLKMLAKMKQLPQKISRDQILYLNLSNPDYPYVKEKPKPKPKPLATEIDKP